MALILNIETSTEICSVSISENGIIKDLEINNTSDFEKGRGEHSKLLAIYIQNILKRNNITSKDLDAVSISSGPGSYTGLRIGVSTCKGFCFGAGLPLISINTLQIIANMAMKKSNQDFDLYIPMIDAKRMEVYTAIFDNNLRFISEVEAKIIDENSFIELKNQKIAFCGNGSDKCKEVLTESNFTFIQNIYPSAEFMGEFAEILFLENKFEDLVYFEPFYLKDFIATTPKNKL